MSATPRDHLLDHEYDGIREFDNPCPGWWNLLYLGTAIFSFWYFIFFQFSPVSWTNDDLYRDSVAANARRQFAKIGDLAADEPTLLKCMQNKEWLAVGEGVFKSQCAVCHGADASGQVGPNLPDSYYKNVRTLTDIVKVVSLGANNGAMPAWKTRLHPNEVVLVSAYVAALRGQNKPGLKIAGEQEIPPWPAPEQSPNP